MKRFINFVYLFISWILIPGIAFLILGNIYAKKRIDELKKNAYRPHPKYTLSGQNLTKYQPNINSVETTYHGDICHLAGFNHQSNNCPFSEGTRKHLFITDKYGYKTITNLSESSHVIIGDSFLSANGGEKMNEQLGYQLANITNFNIYEAAHPADPSDYINRIDEIEKISETSKKYIIMLFEGNDLGAFGNDKSPLTKKGINFKSTFLKNNIKNIYNSPIYKLTKYYLFSDRMLGRFVQKMKSHRYTIKNFYGKDKAFLTKYSEVAEANYSLFTEQLNGIIERRKLICNIVYVPTAHSVYLADSSTEIRHPKLFSQFKLLVKNNIQVIDLTNALKDYSKKNNKMLFWLDDTHWNKDGIKVAAKTISKQSSCLRN